MKISISVFTVLALMTSALAVPVPEPMKKVAVGPEGSMGKGPGQMTPETARVRDPLSLAGPDQILPNTSARPKTPAEEIIADPLQHAKLLGEEGVQKAQDLNGEQELVAWHDNAAQKYQNKVDAAFKRLETGKMSTKARKTLIKQLKGHILKAEKERGRTAELKKDVRRKRKALKKEVAKKLKGEIAQNMKAGMAKGSGLEELAGDRSHGSHKHNNLRSKLRSKKALPMRSPESGE